MPQAGLRDQVTPQQLRIIAQPPTGLLE